MKSIELLPCPFCGGKADFVVVNRDRYRHVVECTKCGAMCGGSAFENKEYNAAVWNRRL